MGGRKKNLTCEKKKFELEHKDVRKIFFFPPYKSCFFDSFFDKKKLYFHRKARKKTFFKFFFEKVIDIWMTGYERNIWNNGYF